MTYKSLLTEIDRLKSERQILDKKIKELESRAPKVLFGFGEYHNCLSSCLRELLYIKKSIQGSNHCWGYVVDQSLKNDLKELLECNVVNEKYIARFREMLMKDIETDEFTDPNDFLLCLGFINFDLFEFSSFLGPVSTKQLHDQLQKMLGV
jgi:hypothetical protein